MQFVQRRDVFQVPGVEFEEDLIEVHGVAPQAGLPVLHLFAERPVGRHETRFGRGRGRLHGPDHGPVVVAVKVVVSAGESRGQQIVLNQRRADEDRRGLAGGDVSIGHLAGEDLEAVEGGLLLNEHAAGAGAPMSVLVGHLAQVQGQSNNPLRIDGSQGPGEQLGSLDDLATNHPGGLPGFLGLGGGGACRRRTAILPRRTLGSVVKHRSREHRHHPVADALVLVAFLADRHMPQQAGQNAAVHRVFLGGTLVELHAVEVFQGPL